MTSVVPFFGEDAVAPVRAFIQKPSLAVEFEVLEIYVQTPGPGAGALLPPAEARWPRGFLTRSARRSTTAFPP